MVHSMTSLISKKFFSCVKTSLWRRGVGSWGKPLPLPSAYLCPRHEKILLRQTGKAGGGGHCRSGLNSLVLMYDKLTDWFLNKTFHCQILFYVGMCSMKNYCLKVSSMCKSFAQRQPFYFHLASTSDLLGFWDASYLLSLRYNLHWCSTFGTI